MLTDTSVPVTRAVSRRLPSPASILSTVPNLSTLPAAPAMQEGKTGPSRRLYTALFQPAQPASRLPAEARLAARDYLQARLAEVEPAACDLPPHPDGIGQWIANGVEQVGVAYRDYLQQRKEGAPRRFFATRSHALHFLGAVAPTKMVDGAWLYGLTAHWQDPRLMPLIRTYLEELGDGALAKNHVALYQRLLAAQECEQIGPLDDAHYVQGAIQLSLAYCADDFLPEVIGFNLGYEQLPLHLLITAYELNELGIDPYYFTLHITVDNADSGHAQKALDGLQALLPLHGDADEFYRRVQNGYKLNNLGTDTMGVINGFDLAREVVAIFTRKAIIGSMAHSDYCRIAGRTVNDWLSDRRQVPAMLQALQEAGWIKRHQPVENSRFWHLIQGERASMFGVFTSYEQQVIADWITGDAAADAPRPVSFRAQQRRLDQIAAPAQPATVSAIGGIAGMANGMALSAGPDDIDAEVRAFEEKVAAAAGREEVMALLVDSMSPAVHWRPTGLAATRLYSRLLAAG